MPTPYDYSLNIPDPSQSFMQGFGNGMAIQEAPLKLQAQQQALQQQQQALAAQQQQQKAMAEFIAKPDKTADDYAQMTLMVPGMREQFKQSWETTNEAQQQAAIKHIGEVGSALTLGKPDVAVQLLTDRATALSNSGADPKEVKSAKDMAELIRTNPTMAEGLIQSKLVALGEQGGKVLANLKSMKTLPADVTKANAEASSAQSDATIKGVQAAAAPVTTELGNRKTAQEIAKSQADAKVAQFNAEIAAANSDTQRGQLTLERDKFIQEQAKLNQTQGEGAQDTLDSLTQGLQTIRSIKDHPGLTSNALWLGGVGSMTGKVSGFIPGTDRKDLEGLVDTLKSQQFLAGVKQMQGMGQLSNAEGDKIGAAVASLNLDQSPQAFKNALGVIETNLTKAQQKVVGRGKLPTTGGAYVATVPGIGTVDEGHVNKILKANPGSTREQVIQYLQSVGGK
jgi:hypothetical protein